MLHTEIDQLIADAMKRRAPELEIYKLIKCEFVKAEKDGVVLDEVAEARIILRMIAQRKDSIEQFLGAGRTDLANSEQAELKVLEGFMPAQLTDEEISEYVLGVIGAYKVAKPAGYNLSMRDMKPIMTLVQEKYPTAPGKLISGTFQKFLQNKL